MNELYLKYSFMEYYEYLNKVHREISKRKNLPKLSVLKPILVSEGKSETI